MQLKPGQRSTQLFLPTPTGMKILNLHMGMRSWRSLWETPPYKTKRESKVEGSTVQERKLGTRCSNLFTPIGVPDSGDSLSSGSTLPQGCNSACSGSLTLGTPTRAP